MKNIYFSVMDKIYELLYRKVKVSSVINLFVVIVELATLAIVWLVAGWKLALVTCGLSSAIWIVCWLFIWLPYDRNVRKQFETIRRLFNQVIDRNPILASALSQETDR